jgi:nucleotide-binding universal stress UspA family protein
MSESPTSSTYDVVLLVEQPLSRLDAEQVVALHEATPEDVRYHLLLPVEDASARVESAMGALSGGDTLVATPMVLDQDEVADIERDLLDQARADLKAAVARMQEVGADVDGDLVTDEPISALAAKVKETSAAEVIVLTQPHVVSEFFHLDWTSRARRKLGVPVLHLLEHENFDEQAGGPEGVTGM